MGLSSLEPGHMIRKRFFIPITLLISCIFLFNYIFLDRILTHLLESQLEEIAEAKASIADIDLSFSPLGLSLYGIKIADKDKPMENLIECSYISASLDLSALLNKHIVIPELAITGIASHTPRKKSGALNKKTAAKKPSKSKAETPASQDPPPSKTEPSTKKDPFSDVNIDALIANTDLSLSSTTERLQKQFTSQKKQLETELLFSDSQAQLDTLQSSVNTFIDDISQGKIKDWTKVSSQLREFKEQSKQINTSLKQKKARISSLASQQKKSISSLTNAGSSDKQALYNTFNFAAIKQGNLSQTLLADPLEKKINTYMNYLSLGSTTIQKVSASFSSKQDSDSVFKGTTISFTNTQKTPRFWIKKISFSTKDNRFSGNIYDLSSNQALIQKNIRIKINDNDASISGSINTLTDPISQQWTYLLNSPLSGFKLLSAEPKDLYLESAHNNTEANLALSGLSLSGNIIIQTTKMKASDLRSAKDMSIIAITRDVMNSTPKIVTNIGLSGSIYLPSFSFSSDIDKKISGRIKAITQQRIAALKKEISDKIDTQIKTEKQKLQKAIGLSTTDLSSKAAVQEEASQQINASIKEEQTKVQQEIDTLKKAAQEELDKQKEALKKESQKEIEKQQKHLEEEANKLLKSLF
ncbi:hypothetical protein DID78_06525 [Candidatus Marinamargulisbacteria bacterium SCGC AG-343-D04]|nr:hypothetical protein DID78_06525 [Candidatus Marinamargulisbacteria bacterium SCGC AG-343-D04]